MSSTLSSHHKGLVVITGASSGIGEATAKLLSSQGYALLLLARRLDRLDSLKLPLALCAKVDVTDAVALDQAVKKAEGTFGPTLALINNAGVMLLGQLDTQETSEWKTMLDVNVWGVLNSTRAVLGGMRARRSGTVITISSIAGLKPFPNHAVYSVTKYAIRGLVETLRMECARDNVRHILVDPGAVETELLSHTTSAEIKKGYSHWKEASGKMLEPQDVAACIAFGLNMPAHVCIREIVLGATAQQE